MTALFGSRLCKAIGRSKYQYLFLIAIVLLAGLLRFYRLGTWGFWLDEIYSVRDAFHLTGQDIVQYTGDPKDVYYPLSYALIRLALALLGVNEWSARSVPCLVGIISIPLLYFPVRKMFNSTVGLLAVLLLAVSPWHLYWSQNARFYSLLLLLCNLSLLFFYLGLETDRYKYVIASGALLALAMLTHITAVLILSALVLYFPILKLLRLELPIGFNLKNIIFFSLAPAASVTYLGLTVLGRRPEEVASMQMSGNPLRMLLGVAFYIGVPLICFALVSLAYFAFIKKSRPAIFLGVGAVAPILLVAVASFFAVTRNRYVFVTLFSWTALGACGIAELLSQVKGSTKFLTLGLLMILVLDPFSEDVLYYRFQNGNREDWRSAFEYVKQNRTQEDWVVVTFPAAGDYYLGKTIFWIANLKPEDVELAGRRVWFVENEAIDWNYPDIQDWVKTNAELVANFDVHVGIRTYKMRVLLYDPLGPP